MNLLLQSLASEEWAYVVKALLHTLWLGGLAAGGLYFVLRGRTDPETRYRWCVGALLAVVFGGIVAWAVLEQRPAVVHSFSAAIPSEVAAPTPGTPASSPTVSATVTPGPVGLTTPGRWTPWLALTWLGGAAVMLARAGSLVVEAEKLRRGSSRLENEAVLQLIEEAQRKLGLGRRIQVVVTEQLTSPAVMGLLTPVVILPISMVTTMPMGDVQLILLHELAHIRRGDYLVNLCQLLTESLLFFNPAVWWISRQIRQEREACCDAMAIALAGEPLQYARTLAQVAGDALAAAPAFGDRRNPSGLKDRIQRLLVPGYRPALRLTWRALLAALFVGGGLLLLSAIGARVTLAAILSPQERMDRIEKKMTELGEKPVPDNDNAPPVHLSGHLRMADGSPAPQTVFFEITSSRNHLSRGSTGPMRSGLFDTSFSAGEICIGVELTNYAPAMIGPLNGVATNRFENLELVIESGFDAEVQLVDAVSGKPLTGGKLSAGFWMRGANQTMFAPHYLTAANGSAMLPHAADLPLVVTASVPGYEILEKRFESVQPNKPMRMALRPGSKVSGVVLDKNSGQPIAGATVCEVLEKNEQGTRNFSWNDPVRTLATTDGNGRFVAAQLQRDSVYWLGVSAAGHESVMFEKISAGQSNLIARLGPELVVRGHVIGNLDLLRPRRMGDALMFFRSSVEQYGEDSRPDSGSVPLRTEDGVTSFEFTNRMAGLVKLDTGNLTFERAVDAPVDDWVIDLTKPAKPEAKNLPKIETNRPPKREVIFRFKNPSGVPPRGTVSVIIPDILADYGIADYRNVVLEITNGEVRVGIPIGGQTSIDGKGMVGYWFNPWPSLSILVTNGVGPEVIEVPVLPAGAIYARARNADGTQAGSVFFGLSELKHAPGQDNATWLDNGRGDGFSGDAPRQWISGPVPLGGTFQVYAWRGNAFQVSRPITLTAANPDAEIELPFPPGKTFDGVLLDMDGKPVSDAELGIEFLLSPDKRSFGLKAVSTDERGRFHLEDLTPDAGQYSVIVGAPGARSEMVTPDFATQPQTIRLKRGRTMAGHVVQAHTGYPIPNGEVTAIDFDHHNMPPLQTRTDADGRFEFSTMGDGQYSFSFGDGQMLSEKKFRADGSTNVVLPVKLYEWSKAKPKAP